MSVFASQRDPSLMMPDDVENVEDILNDSLSVLSEEQLEIEDSIRYGPLNLTVAPKEGKANTLLADHLFSPALFLAERIERGLLRPTNSNVIELGAGCALPSLLLASLPQPPRLVTITDYPDQLILGNLEKNVERNKTAFQSGCRVECKGYTWGTDASELLHLLPDADPRSKNAYDIVILSDLLHFHDCHDLLIASIKALLARAKESIVHVAAGNYTRPHVCDSFLAKAKQAGLEFEEVIPTTEDAAWCGYLEVSRMDKDALALRKAACRYWIGHWAKM